MLYYFDCRFQLLIIFFKTFNFNIQLELNVLLSVVSELTINRNWYKPFLRVVFRPVLLLHLCRWPLPQLVCR